MVADSAIGACSCSALREAARHVTRFYDGMLAPAGLGLNQYSILSRLNRLGPKTVQDLAEHLVMDRSTLGRLLKPLQERGLLAIEIPKQDRRQRMIVLTAQGQADLAKAQPLWAVAEDRFQAAFGADNAQSLRAVLKDVAQIRIG